MDKPSEDEMIRLILRFYAGQNMKYNQTFKQTLESFDLKKFFLYDQEIELLKSKMMELKLLRSRKGRLIITNHGRDIVMKHGGWDKYLLTKHRQTKFSTWISKSEVWIPIAVSVLAIALPQVQLSEVKSEVKQLTEQLKETNSLLERQFVQIDSLQTKIKGMNQTLIVPDTLAQNN